MVVQPELQTTQIAMPKYTPPVKPIVGYFKSKIDNVWVKANTVDTEIPYIRVDVLSESSMYAITMPWAVAIEAMYEPCTKEQFIAKYYEAYHILTQATIDTTV